MARFPRGYRGEGHETIGSDIIAVLKTLRMPEQILGPEITKKLRTVDPGGWYPIGTLLELMELLDSKTGTNGMRQMGRTLFELSHEKRVKEICKSARDILHGLDAMYHHANRGGDIGGWRVLSFGTGRAELEKNTPHHCVMEEGILLQALSAVGVAASISQQHCFRKGATHCHYVITSPCTDARWFGPPA